MKTTYLFIKKIEQNIWQWTCNWTIYIYFFKNAVFN